MDLTETIETLAKKYKMEPTVFQERCALIAKEISTPDRLIVIEDVIGIAFRLNEKELVPLSIAQGDLNEDSDN